MEIVKMKNRIVIMLRKFWYDSSEPILLKFARHLHEYDYNYNLDLFPPHVTIYTPTYNRCDTLMCRAAESVLQQTHTNWRWVVIGDACTDKTEVTVKSINDPRIIFYNMPFKKKSYPMTPENHWFAGPVNAANEALKRVKGQWIARIDDDDIWTKDHLERLLKLAYKKNYEFVSSSYVAVRRGVERVVCEKESNPPIGGTQTWLYRSYLKFMKYNPDCWRKSWNKVNDTDLAERIGKAGVRIGYLDAVTAYIKPRENEDTIGHEAALKYDIVRDAKY